MIEGLDHVALKVSDLDRSTAFYRDVLGASVEELPYGRRRFRIGAAAIHVHGPASTPHPQPATVPGPGTGDLCFRWAGTAESAVAHLAAHGVAPLLPPIERDGAAGPGRSVYFHDPDGTLLELISYNDAAAPGGPAIPYR